MATNVEVLKKIELPTFSSEESLIKTKLELNIKLTNNDYYVILKDIEKYKNKTGNQDFDNYIKLKYPNLGLTYKDLMRMKLD